MNRAGITPRPQEIVVTGYPTVTRPGLSATPDQTTPGVWTLFAGIPRSQIIAAP